MMMRIEHWWNDIDTGKQKYSEKTLSQRHFENYKIYTYIYNTYVGRDSSFGIETR